METMFEGKQKEEMIPQQPEELKYWLAIWLKQLCDGIQNAQCISLAVDKPTDTTDIAKLLVFVRFYDEGKRESLLRRCWSWQTSLDTQGGEDIYEAVIGNAEWKRDIFEESSVNCYWWSSSHDREREDWFSAWKITHPDLSYHWHNPPVWSFVQVLEKCFLGHLERAASVSVRAKECKSTLISWNSL